MTDSTEHPNVREYEWHFQGGTSVMLREDNGVTTVVGFDDIPVVPRADIPLQLLRAIYNRLRKLEGTAQ